MWEPTVGWKRRFQRAAPRRCFTSLAPVTEISAEERQGYTGFLAFWAALYPRSGYGARAANIADSFAHMSSRWCLQKSSAPPEGQKANKYGLKKLKLLLTGNTISGQISAIRRGGPCWEQKYDLSR